MRKHLYITLLIILSGVTACSFVIINDSPVIYKSMEEAMKTPDEVTHLKLIRKKFSNLRNLKRLNMDNVKNIKAEIDNKEKEKSEKKKSNKY